MNGVPLSRDEIDDLLQSIPLPPGTGKSARRRALLDLRKRVMPELESVRLPSDGGSGRVLPDAFNDFKELFIQSFYDAYITPGTNVGTLASMSLGQPISQMSLSAFHVTNESLDDSSERLPLIQRIMNASEINRFPHSYFCLLDPDKEGAGRGGAVHKGDFYDVYNLRRSVEEMTVADATQSHAIVRLTDDMRRMFERHAEVYPERFGGGVKPCPVVLEITLNRFRMYFHKAVPFDIAQVIESQSQYNAQCYWTRGDDGRFGGKFYISFQVENVVDESVATPVFVNRFVDLYEDCSELVVSGVKGIRKLLPVRETVSAIVDNVAEITAGSGLWEVRCKQSHVGGMVDPSDVWYALGTLGAKFIETEPPKGFWTPVEQRVDAASVLSGVLKARVERVSDDRVSDEQVSDDRVSDEQVSDDRVSSDQVSGNRFIATGTSPELVRAAFGKGRVTAEDAGDGRVEIRVLDATSLVKFIIQKSDHAGFYSIVTNGVGAEGLLEIDNIDYSRFRTNDYDEMAKMYGMHAAKYTVTADFIKAITSISSSINTDYISLIVDILFQTGTLTGITAKGVKKRSAGVFARSSLDRATRNFANSSALGDVEVVSGSTTRFLVGGDVEVGTGIIGVRTAETRRRDAFSEQGLEDIDDLLEDLSDGLPDDLLDDLMGDQLDRPRSDGGEPSPVYEELEAELEVGSEAGAEVCEDQYTDHGALPGGFVLLEDLTDQEFEHIIEVVLSGESESV